MKRIKGIISILLVLSISILSYSLYYNSLGDEKDHLLESNNDKSLGNLAIMLQNEDGEYEEKDMSTWPTEGYTFNSELSRCENGGHLEWDEESKSVILTSSGSDKCYVYFDKYVSPIEENIQLLTDKAKFMNATEKGVFLQHTTAELTSAGDNGYRYSGNNPDNFICFGPGSEQYNSGTGTCLPANQYRIIGIVPVTKEDGTEENLIKVIKSEYINQGDLGLTASSTSLSVNTSYAKSPRIQTTSGIRGFYWSGSSRNSSNQWSSSTLKTALNGKYLTTTLGSTWEDKIETVQWNVGGVNTTSVTPKVMKENEEKKEMGGSVTSTDKVGLMYIYDYGFASAEENWGTNVGSYNTTGNQNGNWLFNGVYEWTISRYSSNSSHAFRVNNLGAVDGSNVYNNSLGVRPVFYLKSNVEIKSDGADGSSEHPFRVQ